MNPGLAKDGIKMQITTRTTSKKTTTSGSSTTGKVVNSSARKKSRRPPQRRKKRKRPPAIKSDDLVSKPDAQSDNLSAEKHRDLVSSIFNIGMRESSPAAILENMTEKSKAKHDGLNLERIKSKLQKYRKGKERNKHEFMDMYDKSMTCFCEMLPVSENLDGKSEKGNPHSTEERNHHEKYRHPKLSKINVSTPEFLKTISSLSSGEAAAFLTHSIMLEGVHLKNNLEPLDFTSTPTEFPFSKVGDEMVHFQKYENEATALVLPPLTKEEKNSPLGASIAAFEFFSQAIKKQLYCSRALKEAKNDTKSDNNSDVDDIIRASGEMGHNNPYGSVAQLQALNPECRNSQNCHTHIPSPHLSTAVSPHSTSTPPPLKVVPCGTNTPPQHNITDIFHQKQQLENKIALMTTGHTSSSESTLPGKLGEGYPHVNMNGVHGMPLVNQTHATFPTQLHPNQHGMNSSPYVFEGNSLEGNCKEQQYTTLTSHHQPQNVLNNVLQTQNRTAIFCHQPGIILNTPHHTEASASNQPQAVVQNMALPSPGFQLVGALPHSTPALQGLMTQRGLPPPNQLGDGQQLYRQHQLYHQGQESAKHVAQPQLEHHFFQKLDGGVP